MQAGALRLGCKGLELWRGKLSDLSLDHFFLMVKFKLTTVNQPNHFYPPGAQQLKGRVG